jgi:DNA repair protein RecO (recombination protein O)
MTDNRRAQADQAFVLHTYPYRETSLLLETFTRPFGRVTMIARGARRPRSALRGTLLSFQPLSLAWFGKGEVRTLLRAEWQGGQSLLQGEALLCGFYLNELLMRLLPREDAHETLFERYQQALVALSRREESAAVLRAFEKALLAELGYAMTLDRDGVNGQPLDPAALYHYDPERGPVEIADAEAAPEPQLRGQALLDIARDDYRRAETQAHAKALMRMLINHRLDYQPLRSRRIFRELLEL